MNKVIITDCTNCGFSRFHVRLGWFCTFQDEMFELTMDDKNSYPVPDRCKLLRKGVE